MPAFAKTFETHAAQKPAPVEPVLYVAEMTAAWEPEAPEAMAAVPPAEPPLEPLEDRLLELYEQNDKDEREYAERFGE